MKLSRKFLSLFGFTLAMQLLPLPLSAEWHEQQQAIMGTSVKVRIWHPQARHAEMAIADVMAEMERINQLMSPYIESSELYLLNQKAARRAVPVSGELFALLARSAAISEMSDGAFDITFASVGYLYQYREGTRPDQKQIAGTLDAIDYRHVLLDAETRSVRFDHPHVRIDLGGIAKGYAVDLAYHILKSLEIQHGYVSAGGDSRLIGDRRGRPWMIGVQDPRKPDQQAVLLPLTETAVSTSSGPAQANVAQPSPVAGFVDSMNCPAEPSRQRPSMKSW